MIAKRPHRLLVLTVTAATVAVVSAGWLPVAAGDSIPPDNKRVACKTTGKTVVADADGRVYEQRSGRFEDFYWACLYSTGRAYLLDSPPALGNVVLESRRVAYNVVNCKINECGGDYIEVRNLTTGALRRLDLPSESSPNGIFPGDLELTRRGTVVYIGSPPEVRPGSSLSGVYSFRGGQTRQLDDDVDLGSLARQGNRIYWTKNGSPQTAVVP
jgi:hypothetical protein